jgi:polysaccharide biosynthesis transport protein
VDEETEERGFEMVQMQNDLRSSAAAEENSRDREYLPAMLQALRALAKGWLPVVIFTVACGAAALAWALVTPPTYQASVRMLLIQQRAGAAAEPLAATIPTFRTLVENMSLAAEAVKQFGLDRPPHSLTPGLFAATAMTIETVRETNVIAIKVKLSDPETAAAVANAIAASAERLAQQVSQGDLAEAQETMKKQVEESSKRLEEAQKRLETYKSTTQVELLRKDVEAMLEQRALLPALLVDLQAERARLAQAELLLAGKNRIDTLKRTIDSDPAATRAMAETALEQPAAPVQLQAEVLNPSYEEMESIVAAGRTRLAGMERQRTELVDVLKLDRPQHKALAELHAKETELERLQTEVEIARSSYIEVANRHETARLRAAGTRTYLRVLDPALPPDRPIAPRPLRDTVIAAMFGFMMSIVAVVVWDGVRAHFSKRGQLSDNEPARG